MSPPPLPQLAQLADGSASTPDQLFARAQARAQLGRDAEARRDFQAARSALGDACLIEIALLDIRERSGVEEALVVARGVIQRAAPNSPLMARAYHVAGLAEGKLRRTGPAIDLLLKAVAVYRKLQDSGARAQVYDTIGSLESARGRLDLALHFFALSLVDKTFLGDKAGIAITLGNIGRAHLRLGRYEDALECFDRDLTLSIEIGDARGEVRMHEDIGRTHLAAGDLDAAQASLQRCIDLAATRKYSDLAFFAHKDMALLQIGRGHFDEAALSLAQAKKTLGNGGEPYLEQVLTAAQGELSLATDKPEAAELLEQAVTAFAKADLPDLEIPARLSLAKALLKQKLKATAEDCLFKGMQRARSDGYARYLPILKQEMTRLELSEGVIEENNRRIVTQRPAPGAPTTPSEDYVVIERLGGGSFGEVFRAYDPIRARDVAIKRFRLAKLYDVRRRKGLIASAKLELEAASRVRHPGVVRISGVGFDEQGELYLVSDFVQGNSLRKIMTEPRTTITTILRYLEMIAGALAALHEGGVIHRDLKPDNVIVNPDLLPVLVDFGIAHIARPAANSTAPAAGTPSYMAPEQAKGGNIDAKADLYALGVIAYEWLTGEPPIQPRGTDLRSIAQELASTQPPHIKKRRSDLEPDLQNLVMSLLEKEPWQRPENASKVADVCRKLAGAKR